MKLGYVPTDRARKLNHTRSVRRHFLKKINTLSLVVGILTLICGLGIFLWEHTTHRVQTLKLGEIYLLVGSLILFLRFLLNVCPKMIKRPHRSIRENPSFPKARGRLHSLVKNKEGMVLVVILVVLGALSALLAQTQVLTRNRLKLEKRALDKVRLQSAASDAVLYGLQKLAEDRDLAVDYTEEPWAQPFECVQPLGPISKVCIVDINRTFDLNNLRLENGQRHSRSPTQILSAIFTLCGKENSVERAEALRDWIDKDEIGAKEKDYYKKKNPEYTCPNRWVKSWSELLYVSTFSRDFFNPESHYDSLGRAPPTLLNCISMGPLDRTKALPININTASEAVLIGVLGVGQQALVKNILDYRSHHPFRSFEPLSDMVKDVGAIQRIWPYLDIKSSLFTVNVQAHENGQTEHISAIVRRFTSGDIHILQWVTS